jgi:hypothetical protein
MQEKLILNDGTELEGHVLESGGTLYFYILQEMTLREAFDLMDDPEKTEAITAEAYGNTKEYDGYNLLYCISLENGLISGGLKRAVIANV